MAAIVSRYEADFSKFYQACKQAVGELAGVENATNKVAKAADTASGSFKSDRVIAQMRQVRIEQERMAATFSGTGAQMRDTAELARLMGVNVGGLTTAFSNLGTEMTVAGTAATVVAAAVGGWQLGKQIGEVTGLTDAVSRWAAAMDGLPSRQKAVAEAQADMFKRASEYAGRTITNIVEAERELEEMAKGIEAANRKISEANRKAAEDAARVDAVHQANIAKEQAATLALSKAQIQATADRAALDRQIEKDRAAANRSGIEAANARLDSELAAAEARQAANYADLVEQHRALEATRAETQALRDQTAAANEAALARGTTSNEYDLSTAEGRARFLRANPTADISGSEEYYKSHSLAEAIQAGYVRLTGGSGTSAVGGGGVPTARGAAGASPVVVYAPVQVSGVFDPAAQKALSKSVGDGLVHGVQQSRQLGSW